MPDIADGSYRMLDIRSHSLVAFAAHGPGLLGPVHQGRGPESSPPSLVDGVEVLGKREGCAAGIQADHWGDGELRQLQSRIRPRYPRIVPAPDVAQEYAGQRFARQPQPARGLGQVVGENDASGRDGHHDGPLARRGDLFVGHGRVAGAEIHLFGLGDIPADETAHAFPTADAIVVDRYSGVIRVVSREPLLIQRDDKRRAGPPQRHGSGRGGYGGLFPSGVAAARGCP